MAESVVKCDESSMFRLLIALPYQNVVLDLFNYLHLV